jgi:hypothetical protein
LIIRVQKRIKKQLKVTYLFIDIISLKEEIRGKDSELQNLEKELDTYKNINH